MGLAFGRRPRRRPLEELPRQVMAAVVVAATASGSCGGSIERAMRATAAEGNVFGFPDVGF
jgi:hypothetical protein